MKRLIIGLGVFALANAAFASNDPVADVRQILAGTVTTKSVKQSYLSGAKDNTTAFQGALSAYKAVRAAEVPAPAPVTWTHCANQGETCFIVGTANVRYGVSGHYFTKAATGSIVCDVGPFGGDPIFGTLKTCDTDGKVAPPPVVAAANPCFDAHGLPIAGSSCPARKCPNSPNPVPVAQPCPVAVLP